MTAVLSTTDYIWSEFAGFRVHFCFELGSQKVHFDAPIIAEQEHYGQLRNETGCLPTKNRSETIHVSKHDPIRLGIISRSSNA